MGRPSFEERRGTQEASTASVLMYSRNTAAQCNEVFTENRPSHTNPYVEARREWNDRILDLVAAKRNWQIACGTSLLSCILLAVALLVVSSQQKVVPYLVEVDKLGLAAIPKSLKPTNLNSNELIRHQLGRFIKNARTASFDPLAMKTMLDEAYAYTQGAAVMFLNDYYAKNDPFEAAKAETTAVELVSLLPISDHSWQVRWIEISRGRDGIETRKDNYEALLTLAEHEPKTEQELTRNPLGVYITQLTWTKQI